MYRNIIFQYAYTRILTHLTRPISQRLNERYTLTNFLIAMPALLCIHAVPHFVCFRRRWERDSDSSYQCDDTHESRIAFVGPRVVLLYLWSLHERSIAHATHASRISFAMICVLRAMLFSSFDSCFSKFGVIFKIYQLRRDRSGRCGGLLCLVLTNHLADSDLNRNCMNTFVYMFPFLFPFLTVLHDMRY